jgi:hypothetical protein
MSLVESVARCTGSATPAASKVATMIVSRTV